MRSVKKLFGFGSGEDSTMTESETAKILKRLIEQSLGISDVNGGQFVPIASVAVDENASTVDEFIKSIKNREWSRVINFVSWKGDTDNLEAYLVRIEHKLFLLVLNSPYIPSVEPKPIICEELKESDHGILSLIEQERWESLNG